MLQISEFICCIADCGNKICFNGGTLNRDTCSCDCPGIYGGEQCLGRKSPHPFLC